MVRPRSRPSGSCPVAYDPGLNLFRRLFHRPDPGGLMQMREAVWGALRTADGIRVLDDGTQ